MSTPTNPIPIKDEAHLRQLHKDYFTVSRLASLYGEGFTSAREEAEILDGTLEPQEIDNVMLRRGLILEEPIDKLIEAGDFIWHGSGGEDQDFREVYGVKPAGGLYPHPEIARFGATPDRLVTRAGHESDVGVGEYKVVADMVFREQWEDGPPLRVELQHQGQMACAGCDWGIIAALVIGSFKFELHVWERARHVNAVQTIEYDVRQFLDNLANGIKPEWDFEADGAAIARMYAQTSGENTIDLSGDNLAVDAAYRYQDAAAREKQAKSDKDAAKAELMSKLGEAPKAVVGDFTVSAPTVPPTTISYERKAFRQFRVTERKSKQKDKAA